MAINISGEFVRDPSQVPASEDGSLSGDMKPEETYQLDRDKYNHLLQQFEAKFGGEFADKSDEKIYARLFELSQGR